MEIMYDQKNKYQNRAMGFGLRLLDQVLRCKRWNIGHGISSGDVYMYSIPVSSLILSQPPTLVCQLRVSCPWGCWDGIKNAICYTSTHHACDCV